MATAVNKLLEEMKERLLVCEVCMEDFQSPQRLPRVLPCHHAFCGGCLQGLNKDSHIDCPLCRRSFIVEGTFPVETTRMTLLDLKKITGDQEDQTCEGWSKKLTEKCSKHEEKKLEFYCTECQQPACTSCTVLSHTGHKMVELEVIVKQKREELQAECQRLEAAIPHFKERVKSSAANVEKLDNRRLEISDKVREFFSKARQLLSDKELQTLAGFEAEVKKDRKILEAQQASDEFLLSEAQASLDFGQLVTAVGLPTQILSAPQEMAKTSDDLKERGSTPAAPLPVYEMDGNLDEQDDVLKKIISQTGQDKWCMATHLTTKRKGFTPGNLVCKVDNPPQIQDWWSNFKREKAKAMLLLPGTKQGTFLVRETTSKSGYALSVRGPPNNNGDPLVRHYLIRQMNNGRVYIDRKRCFDSLLALVDHYRADADAHVMCCKLTDACPKFRPMVHFHEFEVPCDSIKLSKKLSDSLSGEVWKGKLYDGVSVAVKTLKPGSKSPEAFLAEAKMLHQLRHQKVVQLMAVCTTSLPVCFMTELCVNGNLQKFLREDKGKAVTFPIMIEMASQIAEGMAYLETQSIVHRDLRAGNILVGDHHDLKVAGFGMARVLPEEGICVAPPGEKFPFKWTAPEAALEGKYSIKSDVWSFGVLLCEIITIGAEPYPGMSGADVLQEISLPKLYRMPKPNGPIAFPGSYYAIMLKCWAKKPEERPTFDFLHNFFDKYFIATEPNFKIP